MLYCFEFVPDLSVIKKMCMTAQSQSQKAPLACIMPWKALYMDECDGSLAALPCCLSWSRSTYGAIGSASLHELWNSRGAQKIRQLIADGQHQEICDPYCPYLMSGRYSEAALHIVDGPPEFVENQKLNLTEIQNRQIVLRSSPMLLKIIPTLRCNLRCSMCYQDHYSPINLGPHFWQETKQLLPFTHEITFQGGEATIDRRFRSFLTSALFRAQPHVRISLITNGTVFDARLVDILAQAKMNYVIISLNAATRNTYSHITKKDIFDATLENIKRWIAFAEDHQRGTFDIFLSFVVMRSNFLELPQFIRLAESLGANIQLLHVIGNRNNEDIFCSGTHASALREVLDESKIAARGAARDQVERIKTIFEAQVKQARTCSN